MSTGDTCSFALGSPIPQSLVVLSDDVSLAVSATLHETRGRNYVESDGFLSGSFLLAMSSNMLQFIGQSSEDSNPKRTLHQLHIYVGVELLGVTLASCYGTDDAIRSLHVQLIFLRRKRGFSHHEQRITTVDKVHLPVLRLCDRFGVGCVRFFFRRAAFEDFRFDARRRKSLLSGGALSLNFPRFVSCLIFLTLCPIGAYILQVQRLRFP